MRPRTALFGAVGTVATVVGTGLLVAPGFLLGFGPLSAAVDAVAGIERTRIGLAAGALVFAALAVTARSSSEEATPSSVDARFDRAATAPPEQATVSPGALTGGTLDGDTEQAIEEGGAAFRDVRAYLYEVAVSAYAERMAVSEAKAKATVDRGQWTDDPVAAYVLGERQAPPIARVRRWLVPTRERERRIRRTVAAIEEVTYR